MIKNITLKVKLLAIMILPILGMLYFASININQKYNNVIESDNIYHITILNTKISSYVHELQKERGFSSGFVSSNGKKFRTKLIEQRDIVNKVYNNLLQYLNSINLEQYDSKFSEFKDELILQYSELDEYRREIINFKLSAKEIVTYYSMSNSLFLNFIYSTSKDTTNTKISRVVLAYSNFLLAKEKTGIQRALMTDMLLSNKSYEKNKQKLNNLIVVRNANIAVFIKLIDDENIVSKYMNMKKDKVISELRTIEKDIINKKTIQYFNVEELFNKITIRINKQKVLSDMISEKLLKLSLSTKNSASNQMTLFTIISIIILLLFIILVFIIYKNIHNGIKNILDSIHFISENSISKYKNIKIVSNDEIGKISLTINEMAEELNDKEEKSKLKNKELEKEKQNAEQHGKAKAEFLANMSHEIRTPLNAVLGFIDLLKEETKGRKSEQYVDIIDKSSKSLLHIIEDILDFSKIESGKLDIDKVDFNSKVEFEVITHLFDAKCSQKNISLTLLIDEKLPKIINTDPLRIKQVIANLISNAVKFTSEGHNIIVNINYDNKLLNISVKDEGIGIAKDKQKYIFEAFGQEDSSTTRKYGGTGLGLSISNELVKLLGGKLEVKSEIDIGSEFYFSIPITIGKELKLDIINSQEFIFDDKKILVVEDNKANQMFVQVLLSKMNIKFDIVNDGLEAIDIFKTSKYDAILMDENMPNMNGIQATKIILEIEKEQNLSHTPIISLTANALKGDRERFMEAGMDEYLTKPLSKKKLVEILKKVLND